MPTKSILFILSLVIVSIVSSCTDKEPAKVLGCTDPLGDNYNPLAVETDSSCTFQNRFLGEWLGAIGCVGLFKTAFTKADMTFNEVIQKDEVNIIIQSTVGPLPVRGKLTKDQVVIDAKLTGLKINLKDLNPSAPDEEIDADATIKTLLTLSADGKILTGDLNIALIPKKDITILGIPFGANMPIPDKCAFTGTKK